MTKDWREIAIASESDERVLKVLKEGPKSLVRLGCFKQ